ncbi:MAG: hypothetical protein H7255_05975 [Ramlibacter sp.]|nr:hypothetical protein [Ramlibacter sp.]
MDTAHKADARPIVIRSAEPTDAAGISALLGTIGTFEGLLQARRADGADAPESAADRGLT